MMNVVYLTCSFFIFSFKTANGAGCTAAVTTVGVKGDVNNVKNDFEANVTNTGFFIPVSNFTVSCCGVVTNIEAYCDSAGTTYFQLWRPVGGDKYQLVLNINVTKSTTAAGSVTYPVPVSDQMTAQIGDVIGWWSSTNVVRHKDGSGENNGNLYQLITPKPTTGMNTNWSTSVATKVDSRTYAVQYTLGSNSNPSFTNFGSPVNIYNSNATGTVVHTVSVTDPNTGDIATLNITRTNTNSFFTFDSTSKQISIASVLSGAVGNHLLTFIVSDTCGNTATGTLTIYVANIPPTIHNLQNSTSISEDTTTAKLLYTLSVTDPTDTVSCTLSTSDVPFNVRQVNGTTNYGIFSNSSPGFNYDTRNSYSLTILCNDGTDSVTGNYTVNLLRNQAPVFTNFTAYVELSSTATTGTVVYSVSATDAENDQLYYNMTCNSSSCPFTIFSSGIIQLNQDISGQTTVGYDLKIYVYDGKSLVGPRTLTVDITNINSAVNINNLPLGSALSVPENTVLGTAIYQISISDPDVGNTHTYSMTSLSGTGMSYFAINSSSGLVSTSGTVLNFETLSSTSFNFTVTVSDGLSTNTKILSIDVTNVNEAPTFNQALYYIYANEASSGTALPDPVYGVTDVDSGETKSYNNDCGSHTGLFTMAPATGLLTFASDYDYDLGTLPTSLLCTVTVTDSGGLTATASLSIKINNINDNIPIFVPASYTFFVTYGSATGTTIGTVTATDGDLGTYGTLFYSLDQSSLNTTYFGVTSLTGQLYVSSSINSIGIDGSVTFLAVVTDGGGLSTYASVIVKVATTTTVTTTTTETRYKSFIEDGRNIAWLTLSVLTIVVILVVVLWLACDINKHGFPKLKIECCKSRVRQITRKRPLPCKKPPVIQFPPQTPPVIPSPPPSPPIEPPPVTPPSPPSPPIVDEPERPSTSFEFWRDRDFGTNLLK